MVPSVSDEYKQSHSFIEYFVETYMKPLNDIYDSIQALDEDDSSYYDQWDSLVDQYQEGLSTYKTAREDAANAYAAEHISKVGPNMVNYWAREYYYRVPFYNMDAVQQVIKDHARTGYSEQTLYSELMAIGTDADLNLAMELSQRIPEAFDCSKSEFIKALDVYTARHSDTLLFGHEHSDSVTLALGIDSGKFRNSFYSYAIEGFNNLLTSRAALHRLEALAPEKHDTFEVLDGVAAIYHDFGDELVSGYRCLVGYPKSNTNSVENINVFLLPLDKKGGLDDIVGISYHSKTGSISDLYKVVFRDSGVDSYKLFSDIKIDDANDGKYFESVLNEYDNAYHVLKSRFELDHEDSFAWDQFELFMNPVDESDLHTQASQPSLQESQASLADMNAELQVDDNESVDDKPSKQGLFERIRSLF